MLCDGVHNPYWLDPRQWFRKWMRGSENGIKVVRVYLAAKIGRRVLFSHYFRFK